MAMSASLSGGATGGGASSSRLRALRAERLVALRKLKRSTRKLLSGDAAVIVSDIRREKEALRQRRRELRAEVTKLEKRKFPSLHERQLAINHLINAANSTSYLGQAGSFNLTALKEPDCGDEPEDVCACNVAIDGDHCVGGIMLSHHLASTVGADGRTTSAGAAPTLA
ncbi:unnamed protein product, partial [Amoebophrya sp. A25]|eukprot:GSA25T00020851001.1